MKYQNGLKIKEIAQILNKSENAVKLILSRARKKLKNSKKLGMLSKIESKTIPSKISFQTEN
jgi:DNA-directed RNA polymerase specialized sigma24 family protein